MATSKTAPADIYIDHPSGHAKGSAKKLIARAGFPIPRAYWSHPAVVKALGKVAPEDGAPGDGQPEPDSYDSKTVKELHALVDERGLDPESNRKADLIAALEAADADDGADED